MEGILVANSYGKSRVRVSQVTGEDDRRLFRQLDVDVCLEGDFLDSYELGDNTKIIPTDSMKNTVNVFARKYPIDSIEGWAIRLGRHFVDTYPQVSAAAITVEEEQWERIINKGEPDPHAFVGGTSERPCTAVRVERDKGISVISGIRGLLVLKTGKSAFKGYIHDEFTTLPEVDERIFSTVITADWKYASAKHDWNSARAKTRQAIIESFADHMSYSVQETLLAMGRAALAVCRDITQITFDLPNKHHNPVNLTPFGLDNPNVVFTPAEAPFGVIKGTVQR